MHLCEEQCGANSEQCGGTVDFKAASRIPGGDIEGNAAPHCSLPSPHYLYPMVHGAIINLQIRRSEEILSRSAIQFPDRHLLNPVVENYLVEEVEQFPERETISIVIHSEEEQPDQEDEIVSAIQRHFAFAAKRMQMRVDEILRMGWKSLFVAFVFMAVMYAIAYAVTKILPENTFMITIRELFIILGWVALWRPSELLLYEWRSFKRKGKLMRKLEKSDVRFRKA